VNRAQSKGSPESRKMLLALEVDREVFSTPRGSIDTSAAFLEEVRPFRESVISTSAQPNSRMRSHPDRPIIDQHVAPKRRYGMRATGPCTATWTTTTMPSETNM
jgi:hypothetical protein